jgi:hypothetical protein
MDTGLDDLRISAFVGSRKAIIVNLQRSTNADRRRR